ncbi:MAG: hypothetical protein E7474_06480 [Ruminococcaceae bacterium]|nr:hypothetical protein [Oscillospiraceae bacterium]
MTFDDVIQDIEKLVGLELQSIRPGASLTILNVDREHSNLLIKTSKGQTKSRPFGELETIWDELNRSPAVHVEGVLHGSGTSRNQPETIFANLPYIEWLRINNKKHIAFVGNVTHAYGTLKQMDPVFAAELSKKSTTSSIRGETSLVIVTSNVGDTISALQNAFGGKVSPVEQGVYLIETVTFRILVVSSVRTNLSVGSYTVLTASSVFSEQLVTLCGKEYYAISNANAQILIRK